MWNEVLMVAWRFDQKRGNPHFSAFVPNVHSDDASSELYCTSTRTETGDLKELVKYTEQDDFAHYEYCAKPITDRVTSAMVTIQVSASPLSRTSEKPSQDDRCSQFFATA